MPHPVTIENDELKLEIWPQLGGKVSSAVDKADDFELLFNYPAEIPTSSQYDMAYVNGWYAGWDECCPAQAASPYLGHPYDGIAVPDHGELWSLPTTAVPTKDGITCVWNGLRFGYRLTRKLWLDGPAMLAEYTLVNLAPFDFHFVWAMHPLLAMDVPVELELHEPPAFRLSHDGQGTQIQRPFDWPLVQPGESLDRPAGLPADKAWKVFSLNPITSPGLVKYPTRRRKLEVTYSSEDSLPAYWGIWINTGGWAKHRHFAVKPTTGRFEQLDRAIRDHSAGNVGPMGRVEWSVRIQVGAME